MKEIRYRLMALLLSTMMVVGLLGGVALAEDSAAVSPVQQEEAGVEAQTGEVNAAASEAVADAPEAAGENLPAAQQEEAQSPAKLGTEAPAEPLNPETVGAELPIPEESGESNGTVPESETGSEDGAGLPEETGVSSESGEAVVPENAEGTDAQNGENGTGAEEQPSAQSDAAETGAQEEVQAGNDVPAKEEPNTPADPETPAPAAEAATEQPVQVRHLGINQLWNGSIGANEESRALLYVNSSDNYWLVVEKGIGLAVQLKNEKTGAVQSLVSGMDRLLHAPIQLQGGANYEVTVSMRDGLSGAFSLCMMSRAEYDARYPAEEAEEPSLDEEEPEKTESQDAPTGPARDADAGEEAQTTEEPLSTDQASEPSAATAGEEEPEAPTEDITTTPETAVPSETGGEAENAGGNGGEADVSEQPVASQKPENSAETALPGENPTATEPVKETAAPEEKGTEEPEKIPSAAPGVFLPDTLREEGLQAQGYFAATVAMPSGAMVYALSGNDYVPMQRLSEGVQVWLLPLDSRWGQAQWVVAGNGSTRTGYVHLKDMVRYIEVASTADAPAETEAPENAELPEEPEKPAQESEEPAVRTVRISSSLSGRDFVYVGDEIELKAELLGFKDTDRYTVQWQYSPDGGKTILDAEDGHELTYHYTMSEENYGYAWRMVLTLQPDEQ